MELSNSLSYSVALVLLVLFNAVVVIMATEPFCGKWEIVAES